MRENYYLDSVFFCTTHLIIVIIFRKLGERGFEDFILPVIFQDCDLDPAVKGLHKVRFDPRHSALVNFWEKMMRPFQINDLSDEFKKMDFERYDFFATFVHP